MSRQLLAFKRAPTVELQLADLHVEVKDDRVLLAIIGSVDELVDVWFSWDEWRDFARRVEHSIRWVEENTPEDVTGTSFEAEPSTSD